MFAATGRRTRRFRSPIVAGVFLITALGLGTYFWTDLCLWRADVNLHERRLDRALAWVARSEWIRAAPDRHRCLLQLRIARRRQDFHQVEDLLRQAPRLGVAPRDLQRERLLAMAQTSQFEQMQGQWSELLSDPRDDGPEIARAYYTWAMLHHQLTLAEKTLMLWHGDYPDDPEPLYLQGRFHEALENWDDAEEGYRGALKLNPGNEGYRLALAHVLQVRLKPAEATPLFEESLRKDSKNLVALQGLAQCKATKGNVEEAVELLRKAMQVNPDDFATQKAYGELLLKAGDAAGAVPVLEQAHRKFPEHANLANSLARALKEAGRNSEAEPLFKFVAESRPFLDELPRLEKKLQQQPDNLQLRMKIASITAKYVSRRDAIRWYENLLRVAPGYVPAEAALNELHRQFGEEQGAAKRTGDAVPAPISQDRAAPTSHEVTVESTVTDPR